MFIVVLICLWPPAAPSFYVFVGKALAVCYTFISTSTPLGRSSFISESTVFDVAL